MPIMSSQHAVGLVKKVQRLVAEGHLSPHDFTVYYAMLFTLRPYGHWETQVAYDAIVRKSGVKRNAVVDAVKRFVQWGLLTKKSQRIRVHWGRNRACVASRVAANLYVFPRKLTELVEPTAAVVTSLKMDRLVTRVERQLAGNAPRPVDNTPMERVWQRLYADNGWPLPST